MSVQGVWCLVLSTLGQPADYDLKISGNKNSAFYILREALASAVGALMLLL